MKKANFAWSKAPTNKKTDLFQLMQPVQPKPSFGEPSTSNEVPVVEVLQGPYPISLTLIHLF